LSAQELAQRLEALAESDPTVAGLARLHIETALAADDPVWEDGTPDFNDSPIEAGVPLLHGQTITVDPQRLREFWRRLVDTAQEIGGNSAQPMLQAIEAGRHDPVNMLRASFNGETKTLQQSPTQMGVDTGPLAVLAHLLALPLLQVCGRRAASMLPRQGWEEGYCPVCGAWPLLAETPGDDPQRWLRCGRCNTAWSYPHQTCTFCGNSEHTTMGYLAPERTRESRRVNICHRCKGYLKSFAVLSPLSPGHVILTDLTSVELDIAATERGYGRPEGAGFPMLVRFSAHAL
jgi:FdhE protein